MLRVREWASGFESMSVLAGLFAQAEAGGGGGGAGLGAPESPSRKSSDGTYRFEVALDPSETQVICFQELVEEQRRSSEASMLDASAASSKASEPDSDKGSCYDSEDSFLDDDELVAELEPSNMKSKIGGFFINTGTMDAEEDPAYGQLGDHYGSGGKAGGASGRKKQKQKKDRKNKEAGEKARGMATDHDASDSQKRQKLSESPSTVAVASLPPAAAPVSASDSHVVAGSIPSAPVDRQLSPRGGSGRSADAKLKKKKGPPLPKIHDGIAARIEDLRQLAESRDRQNDGKCSIVCMSWYRNTPFSQRRRAIGAQD